VASLLNRDEVKPEDVRRNLVISGINLQALKKARFRIGEVEFEGTGDCHPCSRMEYNLGDGGYAAMRGHGGITTRVTKPGTIHVGDEVTILPS
ncbi:MAG: MOSC domain-containing protein, partial [Planctomycetaceae bacterium]